MKSNFRAVLVTWFLLFSAACTTTKIEVKESLTPLPPETPIIVHAEKAPNYGYEVVCDAKVAGDIYSSQLTSYKSKAEEIARKCGTDRAMVESLYRVGYSGEVVIKAIRKTTDEDKITDIEAVKKLTAAAFLQNIANLKKIVTDLQVNSDVKLRSPNDSQLLDLILLKLAEKGTSCPLKSMDYLNKELHSQLRHYGNYDEFVNHGFGTNDKETQFVDTANLLTCPSSVVANSYDGLQDKADAIRYVNNAVTANLNSSYGSTKSDLVSYSHFLLLYPKMIKDVEASCAQDSTSSLCSFKPNLEKVKDTLSRAKTSKTKKAISI